MLLIYAQNYAGIIRQGLIIVHHAKQTLIKDLGAAKTVQYTRPNRWAYATYTMHEIGQNARKRGWAYTTSWAYTTYSTVLSHDWMEVPKIIPYIQDIPFKGGMSRSRMRTESEFNS